MKLILILGEAFLLLFLLERGYRRFWSRDLHVEVLSLIHISEPTRP